MVPESTTASARTIEATRRTLLIGIAISTLLLYIDTLIDRAPGARPEPPALRAAATLLDGAWRFRPGDDPGWANVDADDAGWGTIDLTAAPGSHDGDVGLPDYAS